MENIDKILEVLNEALRSKDLEIGSLKYQLERALDELVDLRKLAKKESEQ